MSYLPRQVTDRFGINYLDIQSFSGDFSVGKWTTYKETTSVTIDNVTNNITYSGTQLQNNDQISFTSLVGGSPLVVNTTYYVINAATNLFQLSATKGGSFIDVTVAGSGTLVRAKPTAGTAGSPSVTFTSVVPSTRLRGYADFRFTKPSGNTEGEGASVQFSVAKAECSKLLQISFTYQTSTGFTSGANSDLQIYIVDTVSGIVYPSISNLDGGSVSPNEFRAVFQVNPVNTTYRLVIHCATPKTTAYTVQFTDFTVGPQQNSTNVIPPLVSKYIGDGLTDVSLPNNVDVYLTNLVKNIETSSAVTLSPHYIFTAPDSGIYTISVNLLLDQVAASYRAITTVLVNGAFYDNYINIKPATAAPDYYNPSAEFKAVLNAGDTVEILATQNSGGTINLLTSFSPMSTYVLIEKVVSSSTSGEISTTAFQVFGGPTGTLNSSLNTIVFTNTPTFDTNSAYNNTTGLYTVPYTGYYTISGSYRINTSTTSFQAIFIAIDGNQTSGSLQFMVTNDNSISLTTTLFLTAGQTISILSQTGAAAPVFDDSQPSINFFSVVRVLGPANANQNEKVKVITKRITSNQSLPTATNTTVLFNSKDVDNNNAYDTTTGIFTAPRAGQYMVSSKVGITGTSGGLRTLSININGVNTSFSQYPATTADLFFESISEVVNLNAGDLVKIVVSQNTGGLLAIAADAVLTNDATKFSIIEV